MRSSSFVWAMVASVVPLSQVIFPGCATLTNGPRQELRVRSKPTAAEVFVNGKRIGTTPATVFVSRWGVHRVRIEMPGYQPYEVRLTKALNGNVTGNVLLGGVWIVVDVLTGAVFEQQVPVGDREPAWREFHEAQAPDFTFNPPLYIVTKLKPQASARKVGQMLPR